MGSLAPHSGLASRPLGQGGHRSLGPTTCRVLPPLRFMVPHARPRSHSLGLPLAPTRSGAHAPLVHARSHRSPSRRPRPLRGVELRPCEEEEQESRTRGADTSPAGRRGAHLHVPDAGRTILARSRKTLANTAGSPAPERPRGLLPRRLPRRRRHARHAGAGPAQGGGACVGAGPGQGAGRGRSRGRGEGGTAEDEGAGPGRGWDSATGRLRSWGAL